MIPAGKFPAGIIVSCGNLIFLIQLEYRHEGFRWYLHRAQGAHLLFALLLLFQQLLLPGDVAAVALCQHVLPHGLQGLPGDDLAADGGLDGHLEKLTGDVVLQLLAQPSGPGIGLVPVGDEAEGVHLISVQEKVHLYQITGPVFGKLIVQTGVALGPGLQGVEEVVDDLPQRHGVVKFHQIGVQILHVLKLPPAVLAERHDVAHIVGRGDDGHLGIGFLGKLDGANIGVVVGIVHPDKTTIRFINIIN